MNLIDEFEKFVKKETLFTKKNKLLIAVSGGIDSVVLADVLHKSAYQLAIAHCNFKLRGKDSDNDEAFVKELADKYGTAYYSASFDTKSFASKNKVSIQMAARRLRYDWLNEKAEKESYDYILTAHHRDDLVETILLNMIKGTGIKGYHGILPKYNLLVRPLLFTQKTDLVNYLEENKLVFREDISNSNIDYQRNLIRHKVVPVLREINPSISKVLYNNAKRIRITEEIYFNHIQKTKERISFLKNNHFYLSKKELIDLEFNKNYLYEWIRFYGFNSSQTKSIISHLENSPGKQFFSSSHQLVIDRDYLIISPYEGEHVKNTVVFTLDDNEVQFGEVKLKINLLKMDKFSDLKFQHLAYLDKDLLDLNLKIRPWKAGDSFYPYGLGKRKKLSDFLTDLKISRNKKQNIYVVTSAEDIVWVVGYRIDERFKLSDKTKSVLRMEILNDEC